MTQYQSFMLRVWYEDDELRIVLENAEDGVKQGFSSLADMVSFLAKKDSNASNREAASQISDKTLLSDRVFE